VLDRSNSTGSDAKLIWSAEIIDCFLS